MKIYNTNFAFFIKFLIKIYFKMKFIQSVFFIALSLFLVACYNTNQNKEDKQLAMIRELKSELPKKHGSHFLPSNENISKIPCPKLIAISPFRTVTHYHDKMMSDTCDYYLYPQIGQYIYLGSSSPTISAKLISPVEYDFKNGAMQVEHSGRYVVRLTRSYHFGMSDISLLHSLKVVVSNKEIGKEVLRF